MVDEKVIVNDRKVSCDGGSSPLGHPKVYLEILKDTQIKCPYCSKLFIYKPPSSTNKK